MLSACLLRPNLLEGKEGGRGPLMGSVVHAGYRELPKHNKPKEGRSHGELNAGPLIDNQAYFHYTIRAIVDHLLYSVLEVIMMKVEKELRKECRFPLKRATPERDWPDVGTLSNSFSAVLMTTK
jgi:hypothetical protein